MSLSFFWNENYGHLYPMLARLEHEKLIQRETVKDESRPTRNPYQITKSGLTEFRQWLAKTNDSVSFRSELLLKMFFGSHTDDATIKGMIQRESQIQSEMLKVYEERENHIRSTYPEGMETEFWLMTLDNGRTYARSQIAWCDRCLKILDAYDRKK